MTDEKSVEILIDYLTITKPDLELNSEIDVFAYIHDYDNSSEWESIQAPRPYRYGVKTNTGAIGGSANKGQGTILSWSGSALQKTNALSIGETALANNWRITRLDCTVDFIGFDTEVEDYLQEYKSGQVGTQSKSHDNHTSENGGHTFYLGSWDSERYLRIYNKRASEARFTDTSQLPDKWLRCELVLRAEHARSAFGFIIDRGVRQAIPALLRGFADFVNIEEYGKMADIPITTKGKGKKDSNRQKWLHSAVFPALIAEMRLDPEFAHDFMSRVADALSIEKI
jgi:hypothetical protein